MKTGNNIKFKVVTRQGVVTATRKIIKILEENEVVIVRFRGYSDFWVKFNEILEVYDN